MDIKLLYDCPVLDCHIHYAHIKLQNDLVRITDQAGLNRINIVCTPDQNRLSLIPDALHYKAQFPTRVFVFGGLDVSAYFRDPQHVGQLFADDIELMQTLGCDGIKMIEGKPQMRKMLPVPSFDSDAFTPFWNRMAETQFPLLMHINDPEEFWDAKRAPKWAFERGWFYGDGSFINNENQYGEILNVLKRNPSLKIIFAHFFFMSAQLPRLAEILDTYPNVSVDLTPGIEMYHNFSANLEATRDFFLRYQDRICFGTDIGARALLVDLAGGIQMGESLQRVSLVRTFLESDGEFRLPAGQGFLFTEGVSPFHGLALPKDVLQKIYYRNFERTVSPRPHPVNRAAMIEYCSRLEKMIEIQGSSQPGVPGDTSVAKTVREYFANSAQFD
jgi:hypothetical protein